MYTFHVKIWSCLLEKGQITPILLDMLCINQVIKISNWTKMSITSCQAKNYSGSIISKAIKIVCKRFVLTPTCTVKAYLVNQRKHFIYLVNVDCKVLMIRRYAVVKVHSYVKCTIMRVVEIIQIWFCFIGKQL